MKSVDPLKYQVTEKKIVSEGTNEIMTIKLRYKQPEGDISKLIQHAVMDKQISIANTSENFRFSAAVAEFGLLLRNSEYKQQASFNQVISLAKSAKGKDDNGYRSEFVNLVESSQSLVKN
jgi:Ca-activated chloride channel family protein